MIKFITHPTGFYDNTLYIEIDGNDVYLTSKTGKCRPSRLDVDYCLRSVTSRDWIEISEQRAKEMLTASLKAIEEEKENDVYIEP